MKFFLDTADITEIREMADTGLIDGVTTNPSLIAKSGRDFFEVISEICEVVEGCGNRFRDDARGRPETGRHCQQYSG